MKKITKKEKIELIKKATKEIQDCFVFLSDDGLKRIPTLQELTHWQMEITRGLLAHSKKVSDATLDLMDNYFVLTNKMMENVVSKV